jgi:hypothetical protein
MVSRMSCDVGCFSQSSVDCVGILTLLFVFVVYETYMLVSLTVEVHIVLVITAR